jgi:DNA polymerase-3 subunit alpha
MNFVHLHNHSDYSILDGAITIDGLISRTAELGMSAVALTDHGNMFGAIEFYQKATKAGITPIIGEEFYIAPGSRFEKTSSRNNGEDTAYHLLILAKNAEGYRNLMKLSSIGYIEGFYYKPRIDMEVLEKHSRGLICASACLAGQIPQCILRGKPDEAREIAGRLGELFGRDHFYLEMQDHGIPEQKTVNAELVAISSALNIPLIATNDAHYITRDDAYSHEVLLCVQTGKTMTDPGRMRFHSDEFYLKSPDEMYRMFAQYPDALYNTCKIHEMIDLTLDLGNPILPNFDVPPGFDLDSYLAHLVNQGAQKIYGAVVPGEVKKRIAYELSVITSMKFSGYFLIVWDVINHARSMNIPVGPGRGSAAGSMVSYCLGITSLDPIKYNLLFERFLNPDRNEMPDMDLDFCADRREEVIEYVRKKYGDDHVSQIITFNKMKAKAVIKDVARALDIPFARSNEISKHIEEARLSDALKKSKELQDVYRDGEGKPLVDISLRLEGLCRSAGKHAAGVVISKGPLTDYVPLYRDKDGSISSQYEKNTLEKAGLVKMDFLGLKNLSIIDRCLKLIKSNRGLLVDIETIPLDDADTFRLLQRADTKGVFQLESSGMQNLLRRLGPPEFEDIIAIVALYRPGPLKSGMADDFIDRKRNPSRVKYLHPLLEPVLKDTLGVVVYQEQVMLISQVIAGFTLPEADKLRKAMGKKLMDIINALEEKFLSGAAKNRIDRGVAESLYDMIKKFGEYGFNKSHSAAYALVTYQTAYLKAHYTIEYMTALMSAQRDSQDDIIQYVNDCRNYDIAVLPPSVNSSHFDFTIEGNAIRFGLGAVKGLGERAIETIITARGSMGGFTSLRDFFERVDSGVVNKGVLESLIKAGAFECLHPNRAQLFASMELLLDSARKLQEDRASGQGDLFGVAADGARSAQALDLVPCEKWPDGEKLAREKEVLGLYVSGHPLARYEKEIKGFSSLSIADLSGSDNGREVSIIGIISNVQVRRAQKSGKQYAVGLFEDLTGTLALMIFGKVLTQSQELIMSSEPLQITGVVEAEGEKAKKLILRSVRKLSDLRREAIAAIHIKLDPLGVDDIVLQKMKAILERHRGDCPIYFHVKEEEKEKIIRAHKTFNIRPSDGLVQDLSEIVGQDSIRYSMGRPV